MRIKSAPPAKKKADDDYSADSDDDDGDDFDDASSESDEYSDFEEPKKKKPSSDKRKKYFDSLFVKEKKTPTKKKETPKKQEKSKSSSQPLKTKNSLVYDVLKRWWYVMPDWPPKDYDYGPALLRRGLRKVETKYWKVEPEEKDGMLFLSSLVEKNFRLQEKGKCLSWRATLDSSRIAK